MSSESNLEDYSLYFEKLKGIPGWLEDSAAVRTIDILNWQLDNGIDGALLEIGVFQGLYFSILANSAIKSDSTLMGVDDFRWTDLSQVEILMKKLFGDNSLHKIVLVQSDSSRLNAKEIIETIKRPRFVSIDGAHNFENVYLDLILAEEILSKDGLISADDFLNPLTIGVNQAINLFLSVPRNVVPVAYISNKLFLSHRSRASDYRAAFESHLVNSPDDQALDFKKRVNLGLNHIEQDFYGNKILIG